MSGREDEYTWAGPYLYSRQVAMVRADSDYTELSQLAGEARGGAGFQHGGKGAAAPRKPERAGDEAGALFLHPWRSGGCAAQELRGHGGGARICRQQPGGYFAGSLPGDSATLYANELGVAFGKGTHEALAARLQTAIDAMREDGTGRSDCGEIRL